jgi:uncharacterized protein (TIGR04255 family)
MAERREVYPNAPLQLVAFEARFPYERHLATQVVLESFLEGVEPLLPIAQLPEPIAEPPGRRRADPGRVLVTQLSKSRMRAVTLRPSSLVVEAADYSHYEDFRSTIESCLKALEASASPPGLERVGLRYVNEVRVSGPITRALDWERFINPALLQAAKLDGDLKASAAQGAVRFEVSKEQSVQLVFATLEGRAVRPGEGIKIRRRGESGPFFLLDIDSFWETSKDVADFSVKRVLEVCDMLRPPVRSLFEGSITDELRNDVLRKDIP